MLRKPFDAFGRYAWAVLAYTVFISVTGVLVRASGSGAGCGNTWPLCYGDVIPQAQALETAIEFTHRIISGLGFVAVMGLAWWAARRYPKGAEVRTAAFAAAFLMITETLAGGSLVLFDWVVNNRTWGRVVVMMVHLTNTHLLVAAVATTAWLASGGSFVCPREQEPWARWLPGGMFFIWLVSALGAVVALTEVVHYWEAQGGLPAAYVGPAQVVRAMLPVHIGAALSGLVYLVVAVRRLGLFRSPLRSLAHGVLMLYGLQLLVGVLNAWLGLPGLVQMLHLLVGYGIWLGWLFLSLEVLQTGPQPAAHTALQAAGD